MRTYLIYLLWSTVLFFCYDCQDVHIYPSPTAEVKNGEALILNCTYTGNNTPVTVKWYLNNDAVGMIVLLTTCNILGTPGTAYEVPRYTINCSTLTIKNITDNDIGDIWGCNVGFALGTPPNVSRTVITKATSTTISTTAATTNTTVSTRTVASPLCWCTPIWRIVLVVAAVGIFVLAVIAVIVGIIIICKRRRHLKKKRDIKKRRNVKKKKCFLLIAIILLVAIIIANIIISALFAYKCFTEEKLESQS